MNRTDFHIHHEGLQFYYVMYENKPEITKEKPVRVRKDDFPIASKLINELMPMLLNEVHKNDILKKKLFSVTFHTTLKGEAMITMVYHKKLNEIWEDAAKDLGTTLAKAPSCTIDKVNIIGNLFH